MNNLHWHFCQACNGRGYHPAGCYMGWPEKDEPCVCNGGKIECIEDCREKDWDGTIDENGNMVERSTIPSTRRGLT